MATRRSAVIAERIAHDLIRSEEVPPGGRLPSIRELQRRYGSSNTTIGYALNILEARGEIVTIHGKGCYVSEQLAKQPAWESRSIGLVSPFHAAHELSGRLTEGIEHACQKHGLGVLVATSRSYRDERDAVGRLVESGCCGVIIWPVTRVREELHDDYLNSEFGDVPIVLFDIAFPEQKRSQVLFDNYRACFQMTEFLLQEGHSRIAFMDLGCEQGEYLQRSTRDRYDGYLDALRTHGLTPRPEDRWVIDVREPMDRAFEELMDRHMRTADRPTAIIAIEDAAALGTIHLARERGLRVPEDLRVVGFDNLRACRAVRPPIPTSDPSFRLAGEVSVDILLRELRGQLTPPTVYMLPVPLLLSDQQRAVSYAESGRTFQHVSSAQ